MQRHLERAVLFSVAIGVAAPVHAYKLRTGQDGQAILWKKRKVQVIVDTSEVKSIGGAGDAVTAAFATWISFGAPVKVTLKPAESASTAKDGLNTVRWEPESWTYASKVVAMTIAWHKEGSTVVTETDIVLNGRDHEWGVLSGQTTHKHDIQNVLTHEAGHFFGLGHSTHAEAAMYATKPPGEISKRSLSADDRAGIAALVAAMGRKTTEEQAPRPDQEPTAGVMEKPGLVPREGVGCSVASGPHDGTLGWLPLVLLGLAALLMKRWKGLAAIFVFVWSLPLPANATVVSSLTLEQMASHATTVVEGRVVRSHTRYLRGLIVTDYTIRGSRCLKGRRSAVVTLRVPGGAVRGTAMHVEGAPRLENGQHVILFGRWRSHGRVLVPIGLSLGVFRIQGQIAKRDLSGLSLISDGALKAGGVERIPVKRLTEAVQRTVNPERKP
jgi:MYXO-CTERM domain-containing protein